uniref:Uncharacterized protein LOC104223609 n=1 Tax=Nicotiana sylvestris TaxID=4096 RepID=A0A1U7W009_NICSY|nr:PREDICTED: uncharacterized protein LOC104223609 [Nicotiana sylvestris]
MAIVKAEIVEAIKDFFKTRKMYRAINCTAITLVPKTTKPNIVKEYRPIACCIVLYKMIAKILAFRLQKVVPDIICEAKQAHDSIEWPFLREMLTELRFPDQFVLWIMECVQIVNYTMMINGEPSEPFNAARGLRQGDPISHFLFAIAMEYLSR